MNKPFGYWENYQYALVFIPSIVGIISALISGDLSGIATKINARPPAKVFGIVWTILYLLIGVAWALNESYYNSQDNNKEIDGSSLTSNDVNIISYVFYSMLIVVLFLWPIFYKKIGNKIALYVLAFSILFTILCMTINPMISNICMSPLLTWLLFALMLNYTDVNKS